MKHYPIQILLLLVLCIQSTTVSSQKILWEKSCGGKHADHLMDVKATPDYGFILAGSSLSSKTGNKTESNQGDYDYWIWKMNEKGDLEWQKSFGGNNSDFLESISLTSDAGFILAGTSASNKGQDKTEDSKGQHDFWILKLDAKGRQEWQKTIGGSAQEKLSTIIQTRDGGYLIGGSSGSEPEEKSKTALSLNNNTNKTSAYFGNLDYWVVKLNSKGSIEWQQTYGGKYVDELRSIEQTFDGGFIIGGYSNSPKSGNKADDNKGVGDYWVIKTDDKGAIIWQKTIGGDKDDQLYVAHQTIDKGYILGGNSNSNVSEQKIKTNSDGTDFWILKLDENGIIKWQETFNFGKFDLLTSLIENEDHTYLIGGFAKGETTNDAKLKIKETKAKSGTDDYIALKIDEKGQELWSKTVGSDGEDALKKVIETRDGGYLFAGTSDPQMTPSITYGTLNSRTGSAMLTGMQGDNQQISAAKNDVNTSINQTTDSINKEINTTLSNSTKEINTALGLKEDSPLKLGNSELGNIINAPNLGDQNNSAGKNESAKKLPPSGDKKNSFGNKDFWVVKIKDEDKKEKPKLTIEAVPNPTLGYTNIVIGYEFETGTATLVDLAGHILEKFDLNGRTVPIDLSAYPEGIYIVNITTNVQSDGVKIIKGITKN